MVSLSCITRAKGSIGAKFDTLFHTCTLAGSHERARAWPQTHAPNRRRRRKRGRCSGKLRHFLLYCEVALLGFCCLGWWWGAPVLVTLCCVPIMCFPVSPQEISLPPRFRALSHSSRSTSVHYQQVKTHSTKVCKTYLGLKGTAVKVSCQRLYAMW